MTLIDTLYPDHTSSILFSITGGYLQSPTPGRRPLSSKDLRQCQRISLNPQDTGRVGSELKEQVQRVNPDRQTFLVTGLNGYQTQDPYTVDTSKSYWVSSFQVPMSVGNSWVSEEYIFRDQIPHSPTGSVNRVRKESWDERIGGVVDTRKWDSAFLFPVSSGIKTTPILSHRSISLQIFICHRKSISTRQP